MTAYPADTIDRSHDEDILANLAPALARGLPYEPLYRAELLRRLAEVAGRIADRLEAGR